MRFEEVEQNGDQGKEVQERHVRGDGPESGFRRHDIYM
jgi:hypothetical protein